MSTPREWVEAFLRGNRLPVITNLIRTREYANHVFANRMPLPNELEMPAGVDLRLADLVRLTPTGGDRSTDRSPVVDYLAQMAVDVVDPRVQASPVVEKPKRSFEEWQREVAELLAEAKRNRE